MKLVLYIRLFFINLTVALKSWEPTPGTLPTIEGWLQIHETLLNVTQTFKSQIKTVFLGDSITYLWSVPGWGIEIWNKYYLPRGAYNYGIPGDTTNNVIWRIQNGEFDGLNPKVVVIMIGANNILIDAYYDIAKGINAVIWNIKLKMPKSKIILLSVLPFPTAPLDTNVLLINKKIAKHEDNKMVYYLDIGSHGYRISLGNQNKDVFGDLLHINRAGFTLWQQLMESLFYKLYNSDAVKPWEPAPSTIDGWMLAHEYFLNETKTIKCDIKAIFLGDSTMAGWSFNGYGLDIWNEYYVPRKSYNYAIPGDTTSNVIWRIQNGEFDGLNPKVIVLMIGLYNGLTDEYFDISKGIKTVIKNLRRKMPKSKIILLSLLPVKGIPYDVIIELINKKIAELDDDKKIYYLDISSHGYRTSLGNVNQSLYKNDFINNFGFALWHQLMKALFDELYND